MRKTYLCNNNTINPTNMKKILFIIGVTKVRRPSLLQ